MMYKKRLCKSSLDGVKDGRKVKKFRFAEDIATAKNVSQEMPFCRGSCDCTKCENLTDEHQPQFFNYMLVGDMLAVMILNSKSLINQTKSSRPILYQNYCNSTWSVGDVLNELKSKKNCYPIAKTCILSVGYNDYCSNSLSALMLVDGIEKIIQKLRKRGCQDLILTNIPPAAAKKENVDHWEYLQTVNSEILRLSEKYDFIGHCNIFKLFSTPKNYFSPNKEYVTFREINYKIDILLYNDQKRDMISFNDLGKTVLGKHMEKTVQNRIEFLRRRKIDDVICTVEISDSGDEEVVSVEKREPSPDIIDLAADEEDDKKTVSHIFGCTCPTCEKEDQQLMKELLSIIE